MAADPTPESPGRCWDCGSPHLHADADAFACESCGARWHVEGPHVRRATPTSPIPP